MRRPLADAGLIFVLIILIVSLIHPISYTDYSKFDKSDVFIHGTLIQKEIKTKDNSSTPVYYLNNVILYSPSSQPLYSFDSGEKIICYMEDINAHTDNSNISLYPAASEYLAVPLGNKVILKGTLKNFEHATNPGMFDSKAYYETMKISMAAYNCRLTLSTPNSNENKVKHTYWKISEQLFKLRLILGYLLDLSLYDSDSGIAKTMVLGDKSGISESIKNMYNENGIAHILAISGLHISMLGLGFFKLQKRVGINNIISALLSIILMMLYGLMCGITVASLRAVIMFLLRMFSKILGRTYDMETSMIIAAVIILITQPRYLFYSGFLFSFGAIFAIIFISPLFEDIFISKDSSYKKIAKALLSSIPINMITLPVYLCNYYCFPVFSILINIIVIPLMSLLIAAMLLSILACAIYIPAGRICGLLVHAILYIFESLCKLGDIIPINKMLTGKPQAWQIIIYIAIIIVVMLQRHKQSPIQIVLDICLAGIILTGRYHTGTELIMLDIGQGDSIYITDNRGSDVLVDSGSSSVSEVAKYRLNPFLLSRGIQDIDAVFISHLDSDHYNAILELMNMPPNDAPQIKRIYLSTATAMSKSDEYYELINLAKQKDITVLEISKGDVIQIGKLKMECLYPIKKDNIEAEAKPNNSSDTSYLINAYNDNNTNEESMVLMLKEKNTDILLTGDIEGSGEIELTDIINHEYTHDNKRKIILKAAHHGSKNSSSDDFLDILSPNLVLISAGKNNRYHHPHIETLERYEARNIPYFCTSEYGALMLKLSGDKITLKGFIR